MQSDDIPETEISPDCNARVRASLSAQGLMTTLGARISALSKGKCRISAPIRASSGQQMGYAHAGLTFAIGDSAQGYAALTLLGEAEEVVTAEMKINLLAPAQGSVLIAEGRVLRAGRRLIVTEADVWASGEDGSSARHVARLLGTIVPVQI